MIGGEQVAQGLHYQGLIISDLENLGSDQALEYTFSTT